MLSFKRKCSGGGVPMQRGVIVWQLGCVLESWQLAVG